MKKYKVVFKFEYEYCVDAEDEYNAVDKAEENLSDTNYDGYSVEEFTGEIDE